VPTHPLALELARPDSTSHSRTVAERCRSTPRRCAPALYDPPRDDAFGRRSHVGQLSKAERSAAAMLLVPSSFSVEAAKRQTDGGRRSISSSACTPKRRAADSEVALVAQTVPPREFCAEHLETAPRSPQNATWSTSRDGAERPLPMPPRVAATRSARFTWSARIWLSSSTALRRCRRARAATAAVCSLFYTWASRGVSAECRRDSGRACHRTSPYGNAALGGSRPTFFLTGRLAARTAI